MMRRISDPYCSRFYQTSPKRGLLWLLTGIVAALTWSVVYAQGGYPQPKDLYVNDYAGLLTAEDAASIRRLFVDLKRDTGIEAVVVTINSIKDYDTGDGTIESFATNLFNRWGIGDRQRNNGVLILVAVRDRQVRIELGSGYGSAYNADMQQVINEHMLPSFRRNEYSRGIYNGARALVRKLAGRQSGFLGRFLSGGLTINTNRGSFTIPLGGVVCGGAIAAAVMMVAVSLRRYARYRKRRCPNCRTRMTRLDEASDDVYLDSGQKLEEFLSSVDYDVWKCPNCGMHTLHGYNRWFASFGKCPMCGRRTVAATHETLVEPTYTSTGAKRITSDCRHCDYHREEVVVLPVLTRSDSRDDFGGGSSAGGGATGSW